jgi:hypothetical protein
MFLNVFEKVVLYVQKNPGKFMPTYLEILREHSQ